MSRIGKNPVLIPEGVKIKITGNNINVEGPRGVQEWDSHPEIDISEVDGELHVERPSDSISHKSLHGTTRQIINNMVLGVSDGFVKELEVIGIGYQALVEDNRLKLKVGYSHDIYFDVPEGIIIKSDRSSIRIEGIDKQLVGAVAAKIRSFRKPEPYKGKGIRYKDEYVRSKQGKTVGE